MKNPVAVARSAANNTEHEPTYGPTTERRSRSKSGSALLALCLTSLLWGASAAHAAPGDLDPTFGTDGLQTTDFGGSDFAEDVVVQPDGKIIAVGGGGGSNGNFLLARYNPDGTLDTTFSDDGKQATEFRGSATSVALQGDGKIVVGGQTIGDSGFRDFALARYDPDGSLDTTFGDGGKQTTDVSGGGDESVRDLVVQADGKIVAVGGGIVTNFLVARYESDGSLDSTFGDGGTEKTRFPGFEASAYSVALQSDSKIVVGGRVDDGNDDFALARYNPDGSLDTTFSEDGRQTTDFGAFSEVGYSVALQPDGKIVLGGGISVGDGEGREFALARYNEDGSLDLTFSDDGKQTTSFGPGSFASMHTVLLQPDGKIVGVGEIVGVGGDRSGANFALVRYNAQGSLDTTFGDGGRQTTAVNGEFRGESKGGSATLQQDGKPVVVGGGRLTGGDAPDFVIARYEGSDTAPPPDAGSGPDPSPEPPAPQPPASQPPAQQPAPPASPPAPVQSGPPVEGDPGYTYPAKLRVARAEVDRENRKLDVFAPLTSRAFGDDVDVAFRAAGRTAKYNVSVTSGDAAFDRIRFKRTITREQADLGTGIVTIQYPGNEVTRPQEVRLRAASRQADLEVEEISLQGDRLSTSGMLDDRAKGVVRLELSYLDVQGRPQVFKTNAEIEDGEWSVNDVQVPSEIAQRGAYVSVLFTGYYERRIRGEMISYQIEPGETRRPD